MSVEVEVISTEIVKPLSPTPQHLRHYHISFIDQITPQISNSMVYFFNANDVTNKLNINEASNLLKKSLSQVLTHFYPLAGRLIPDKSLVECNDDGVPYIETKVRCNLSHVANNASLASVHKLLPYDADEVVDTVLGVQFNVFDCGGIAIGVCLSHKIADALSYFQFIKSWAAMTRGEPEHIKTHFQAFSLFPPKDQSVYNRRSSRNEKEKIVCKRFLFEASMIESLRIKYSKMMKNVIEGPKFPSRVAALSTFMWTRLLAATKGEEGSKKMIHLVGYTVNLRPRMDPPLPEYAFGNYAWFFRTFPTLDDRGECNNDLSGLLREELSKIDDDFFVRLREGEEWNPMQHGGEMVSAIAKGEMDVVSFTSLCRFPVNEVDFGWGNPTLVVPTVWKVKNLVALKDANFDGGIEAYISLTEDDMAKFERDKELVAHVSTTRLK